MDRRKFIKQAGLSTVLLTAGGLPQLLGNVSGGKNRLSHGPRPDEWVEKQCYAMYSLTEGFSTNVYTGYIIPRSATGWRLVEAFPMNLEFAGRHRYPVLYSAAFDHDITCAYAERRTRAGRLRVDYLLSDTHQTIYTKQFLIELDGQPLGRAGVYHCGDCTCYTNWFGGVRHGDLAFVVKDATGYDREAYRQARLEIWRKKP